MRPIVVVTGAADGQGAAETEWLASHGWHVVGVDVTGAEIPVDGGLTAHGGGKAISDALRQEDSTNL